MAVNRIPGVVSGVVTDNRDPRGFGRIKFRSPSLGGDESGWARMATPSAGDRRGIYFLPEVGDEVLVAFDRGDPRRPYVVGCLWGGKAETRPPERNTGGRNDVRVIRSRSGHQIRFDDSPEGERIEIIHSGGRLDRHRRGRDDDQGGRRRDDLGGREARARRPVGGGHR